MPGWSPSGRRSSTDFQFSPRRRSTFANLAGCLAGSQQSFAVYILPVHAEDMGAMRRVGRLPAYNVLQRAQVKEVFPTVVDLTDSSYADPKKNFSAKFSPPLPPHRWRNHRQRSVAAPVKSNPRASALAPALRNNTSGRFWQLAPGTPNPDIIPPTRPQRRCVRKSLAVTSRYLAMLLSVRYFRQMPISPVQPGDRRLHDRFSRYTIYISLRHARKRGQPEAGKNCGMGAKNHKYRQ